MGSPPDEPERRPDEAQVEVRLTRGFWMGKYAVTQGQWKRVAGKLPGDLTAAGGEGDKRPGGAGGRGGRPRLWHPGGRGPGRRLCDGQGGGQETNNKGETDGFT